MALARTFRCDSCGRRTTGTGVLTVTGRRVCEACDGVLMAAAAGVLAQPETPVVGAIATAGWFALLRRWRRQREGDQHTS